MQNEQKIFLESFWINVNKKTYEPVYPRSGNSAAPTLYRTKGYAERYLDVHRWTNREDYTTIEVLLIPVEATKHDS